VLFTSQDLIPLDLCDEAHRHQRRLRLKCDLAAGLHHAGADRHFQHGDFDAEFAAVAAEDRRCRAVALSNICSHRRRWQRKAMTMHTQSGPVCSDDIWLSMPIELNVRKDPPVAPETQPVAQAVWRG